MAIVLDTSALLATLQGEPGKDRVDAALMSGTCLMSSVNLAKFAGKCLQGGMRKADLLAIINGFDLDIVDFDTAQAVASGELRAATRHLGLSLGDRACLALTQQRNAVALTADKAWSTLDVDIRIEVIR